MDDKKDLICLYKPPEPKKWWQNWLLVKMAEIVFVVVVTLLVSTLIASLPLPAPGMSIIEPKTDENFFVKVVGKDSTGYPLYNGTKIDVNIKTYGGLHRYIIFDSEFLHRAINQLSLAPKIWVMTHKHGSLDEWTPFEEVHDLANGFGSASVILYAPNESWDIALVSINSRDDQYFKGYLATIRESGGFQRDKPFPESGHIITEVVVRTINITK